MSNAKLMSAIHVKNFNQAGRNYTDQLMANALEEVDTVKADKPAIASATLPVTGWVKEAGDTSGYAYHYDLSVEGLTTDVIAHVVVSRASMNTATDCGLCPVNETINGAIRFFAASIPENAITLTYWLENQAEEEA